MSAPRASSPTTLLASAASRRPIPAASAWVAANAGSGKTHVLAQRVIRLLLDGVDAGENPLPHLHQGGGRQHGEPRVRHARASGPPLDDAALDAGDPQRFPSVAAGRRSCGAQARRLFAPALETPGGLKVQTIHAFCTRLLHQFPFEANVAARFEVLDEAAEAQLLDQVSLGVLLEAAARARRRARPRARGRASPTAADQTFKDALGEAIRKRDVVQAWIEHGGGVDARHRRAVRARSASTPTTRSEQVEADDRRRTAAAVVANGRRSPRRCAQRLEDATRSRRSGCAAALRGRPAPSASRPICRSSSPASSSRAARIVTRGHRQQDPALAQRLIAEQRRACARCCERRKAVACRDRTAALLTIADAVIARYQAEKDRRGLLDYDDLIDKTLALLAEVDAAWVHYKLDRGIDHVLIDEAQDTSPKQWADHPRADRRVLRRRRRARRCSARSSRSATRSSRSSRSRARRRASSTPCAAPLRRSRRGDRPGPAIRAASAIRSAPAPTCSARSTRCSAGREALQRTVRRQRADRCTNRCRTRRPAWSRSGTRSSPSPKREIEAWDAPFDDTDRDQPAGPAGARRSRAHDRAAWRTQGRCAPATCWSWCASAGRCSRRSSARSRTPTSPVAGADRLVLTEHIAVMDLMVLADALLLPDDDLALATVLKSPLFGFDDDDLFELAWQRHGSLRAALRAQGADAAALRRGGRPARSLRAMGAARHAVRLLRAGCSAGGAAASASSRGSGHEADDALDEFLNLALDYERRETPSLQGFVAWLRTARTDVKRDMEIARDEVRVMTVHGAKGLEAPIVILADTTTPPAGPPQRQPRLLALPARTARRARPTASSGPGRRRTTSRWSRPRASARAARPRTSIAGCSMSAMTRAIDRLIVCGAEGERGRPEGCWWDLVAARLAAAISVEEPPTTATARSGAIARRRSWRSTWSPPSAALGGAARRRLPPGSDATRPPRPRRLRRSRPRAPTTRPR